MLFCETIRFGDAYAAYCGSYQIGWGADRTIHLPDKLVPVVFDVFPKEDVA